MPLPLVVGTDGSDAALRAVDWAADEAALRGAPLRIVYASLLAHYEEVVSSVRTSRASGSVFTQHIVASASERCERRHPDVAVSADILAEDPAEGLLGEGSNALAIVVGNRGRGELAALLLGSVSLSVAARAQCPVIVVRSDEAKPDNGDRWIALGVGDRGTAKETVDFAFTEAALRGARVAAVHAWRSPTPPADTGQVDDARQVAQREAEAWMDEALRDATAKHPEVRVRREVVEGHARESLLDAARSAELLVVGARRRSGAFGLQLGLVNHAMLHHSPCPVAVVPHE